MIVKYIGKSVPENKFDRALINGEKYSVIQEWDGLVKIDSYLWLLPSEYEIVKQ